MTWGRLLLALLVVPIIASTSAAECAWVLWIKNETTFLRNDKDKPYEVTTRWEMEKAFQAHAECEQIKEQVWTVEAGHYNDLSQFPGIERVRKVPYEAIFISWKQGAVITGGGNTKLFRCYPDTIDPREK
jgi:hypothetical protein